MIYFVDTELRQKMIYRMLYVLSTDLQRHSVWCWKYHIHRLVYNRKEQAMSWCVISWSNQPHVAFGWRVVPMNPYSHHFQRLFINIQSHRSLYHVNWLFRTVIYKMLNIIRRHNNNSWHKVLHAMYFSYSHTIRNRWPGQKQFEKRYHCYTHENRCQNRPKFILKSHNRESHWLIIHVNYSSGTFLFTTIFNFFFYFFNRFLFKSTFFRIKVFSNQLFLICHRNLNCENFFDSKIFSFDYKYFFTVN